MLLKNSRLALAQTNSVLGNLKENVTTHLEIAQKAIIEKASAVVFPELSLTGYNLRDLNFEVSVDPETCEELKPLLDISSKITIICGGVHADGRGAVYNSAFVLEDKKVIHVHHKIYPPSYGIFEEGRYFTSGKSLHAFDSRRLGRVGVLVCEDLWHPVLPYLLSHQDAQMIITIAASPTRLDTGEDALKSKEPENYCVNREHHSSYARLLGLFIAFVNRVGVEDGINFWGGSELVAPSGEPLKRCEFFKEDLQYIDIDPNLVRQARPLSRHAIDDDLNLTRSLFLNTLESNR